MTVVFSNKSELPLECIKTFGVSVKENAHPIGYFGTGLKYAIAVLLRENCSIKIVIAGEAFEFSVVKKGVRGKDFDFIYMNGELLPFTTELGKNWELWQAYRELYSNCMDEGGKVSTDTEAADDVTRIYVRGLDEVHAERHRYILMSTPKHRLEDLEIHESAYPAIFYKGIKVLELETKYSYNILSDIELTEDRTASQYDVNYAITKAISNTNLADAIIDILSIEESEGYYESQFSYNTYIKPSETFMQILANFKKKQHNAGTYFTHWESRFVKGLPRDALSPQIQRKLRKLQESMSFQPKEIFVMPLDGEDFKIIDEGLCLNVKLMNQPKKLQFVYTLACLKMSHKEPNRSNYDVIVDRMLPYLELKNVKKMIKTKAA